MSPRHHPSDDILAVYVAGTLEPGFGLVAAAHVEACVHCRARVSTFEAASGVAFKNIPASEVSEGPLGDVLARLDALSALVARLPGLHEILHRAFTLIAVDTRRSAHDIR